LKIPKSQSYYRRVKSTLTDEQKYEKDMQKFKRSDFEKLREETFDQINLMAMESRRKQPEKDYSSKGIVSGQGLIMMNKSLDDHIEKIMQNAREEEQFEKRLEEQNKQR
jgi:CRISPR/Cas system CSM-associated protein Csm5 (group 7 of RAMP superfamily)